MHLATVLQQQKNKYGIRRDFVNTEGL